MRIFLSLLFALNVLFAQYGGKNKCNYRSFSKFKLIVVLGDWRLTQDSSVYGDLDCGLSVLISCALDHSVKTCCGTIPATDEYILKLVWVYFHG